MPLYTVQHACPLSLSQKDELAMALTLIHSNKFTTPKNFVNVSFTDVSKAETYIGGHRATGNHIRANVRAGPSRTQEDWNELCREVERAWYEICGTPLPQQKGRTVPDTTLRSVIVLGGIIAGLEAGFVLPIAGGDVAWLEENYEEFQRRADGGDEEMAGMLKEIKERGLLDGTNGLKTQQQRLEEMLGWGDSA
jgi:phenylpyruvate tautomerase PptA (4-oxalocrotonate tautomerase family)